MSLTIENTLIQVKQDYLPGLLSLYDYQSKLRFLYYRYIKFFAKTKTDHLSYIPKQC